MIVVYLIELMELRAGNKRKVILFFILNLLTCFITMAKSQLFTVIFTSVVILHRKKKISVKQLLTVTAICFALFVVMQLLRSNDVTDFSVLEFLAIYILSGTVAFDHFEPLDMGTGSNVFRFL